MSHFLRVGLLFQVLMRQVINVTEDHGIATGIPVTQSVTGWGAADFQMVKLVMEGTHILTAIGSDWQSVR